jgi:hypothetical protein
MKPAEIFLAVLGCLVLLYPIYLAISGCGSIWRKLLDRFSTRPDLEAGPRFRLSIGSSIDLNYLLEPPASTPSRPPTAPQRPAANLIATHARRGIESPDDSVITVPPAAYYRVPDRYMAWWEKPQSLPWPGSDEV